MDTQHSDKKQVHSLTACLLRSTVRSFINNRHFGVRRIRACSIPAGVMEMKPCIPWTFAQPFALKNSSATRTEELTSLSDPRRLLWRWSQMDFL